MKFKIRTQNGLILSRMWESKKSVFNPWLYVGDFCGGRKDCPYIGYKAATRIGELQKLGLLESRWSHKKVARKVIEENGVDVFLDNLLENLKGNFVTTKK